jgi:hypothetical protein
MVYYVPFPAGARHIQAASRRTDIDHTTALRTKVFESFASSENQSKDVGTELPMEIVLRNFLKGRKQVEAGIMDEDSCPKTRFVSAILVDDAIGAFFAGSVVTHNGGAFGGQTFGDVRADSPGSAGYGSYFTL